MRFPTRRTIRTFALLPAAGAALAVLAACGGQPPAASAGTAAPAAPAGGPGSAPTTVNVTMTEFSFALDRTTLTPGAYVFHAVNKGKFPHGMVLQGAGVDDAKSAIVQPGGSTDLPVTVQAGDLDLYCPVDGHRAKGMETHLTVGAAAPASTATGSGGGGGGY